MTASKRLSVAVFAISAFAVFATLWLSYLTVEATRNIDNQRRVAQLEAENARLKAEADSADRLYRVVRVQRDLLEDAYTSVARELCAQTEQHAEVRDGRALAMAGLYLWMARVNRASNANRDPRNVVENELDALGYDVSALRLTGGDQSLSVLVEGAAAHLGAGLHRAARGAESK